MSGPQACLTRLLLGLFWGIAESSEPEDLASTVQQSLNTPPEVATCSATLQRIQEVHVKFVTRKLQIL